MVEQRTSRREGTWLKILFCCDSPLYKNAQGIYHSNTFTDEFYQRYLCFAESLHVTARVRPLPMNAAGGRMQRISHPAIRVVEIPNLMCTKGILTKRSAVKRILRREIQNADAIFLRLPSLVGTYGADIAKEMGKPYLAEVVGCPWDSLWNHSFKGKLVAFLSKQAMKRTVWDALYVSYVTKSFLQSRYPTQGKQIACSNVLLAPVDEAVLGRRIARIHSRRPGDKVVLGTAAGLDVPYKGQQYIIRALAAMKWAGRTNFEYQLAGVGTGERLRKEARSCGVEGQVKIVGSLTHQEIFRWMDGLDIYCQPSKQEGLPRAMIEAMSRGLPCMGGRAGGIPEIVGEEWIFNHGSHAMDEICEILGRIADSPDLMHRLAEENYREAKRYKKDVLEERRRQFFEEFLEKTGII